METLLKKPEIFRDSMGRFDRNGKTLSKTAKTNNKITGNIPGTNLPGRGPGRPPGSPNKVTAALKDMILGALDKAGGEEYLAALARENSSAFASLLGKVLPTTLAASETDGGTSVKIAFERVIVWPDGHREIEGVTPKVLPAPASHALPSDVRSTQHARDSLDKYQQDQ